MAEIESKVTCTEDTVERWVCILKTGKSRRENPEPDSGLIRFYFMDKHIGSQYKNQLVQKGNFNEK